MCGSSYQACPKVPESAREHNECYTPKAGVFSCLNRMDKFSDIFTQNLYKKGIVLSDGAPLNLNKLPFEILHDKYLRCQENNLIEFDPYNPYFDRGWGPKPNTTTPSNSWAGIGIDVLRNTKSCQSKSGKKVDGLVLFNLLIRDMGFKGRHLIRVEYLRL